MRRPFFTLSGALLLVGCAFLGFVQLGYALRGSAESWMALSLLFCGGVMGAGMVRAGARAGTAEADSQEGL